MTRRSPTKQNNTVDDTKATGIMVAQCVYVYIYIHIHIESCRVSIINRMTMSTNLSVSLGKKAFAFRGVSWPNFHGFRDQK